MKHRKLNTALLLTSLILSACGEEDPGSAGPLPTLDSGPTLTLESPKKFHFTWSEGEIPVTHYRLLENPDGKVGFSDVSGAIPAGTENFTLEVPLHKRINARYILERCNEAGCKDSQTTFVNQLADNNLVGAIGRLKPPSDDILIDPFNFGENIAVSGDGTTLAVSSQGEEATFNSLYIFTHTSTGTWQERHKREFGRFISSLSISDDGSRIAVGLDGEGNNTLPGGVEVLRRADTDLDWSEGAEREFIPSGADIGSQVGDLFGFSVSLNSDGSRLAIGAPNEDSDGKEITHANDDGSIEAGNNNSAEDSGAVYIYHRSGIEWNIEAFVKASNANKNDKFGKSVSFSDEADRLVVGTPSGDATNSDGSIVVNTGAVYVYHRNGTTWAEEELIQAINPRIANSFGNIENISLSGDGSLLAVGAELESSDVQGIHLPSAVPGLDNIDSPRSGAVYLYRRTGTNWAPEAYIKASNNFSEARFGQRLKLSSDGLTLVVGIGVGNHTGAGVHDSPTANNTSSTDRAAYVFKFDGANWQESAFVMADRANAGLFSEAIALSNDGKVLAISAPEENSVASHDGAGAVYIY